MAVEAGGVDGLGFGPLFDFAGAELDVDCVAPSVALVVESVSFLPLLDPPDGPFLVALAVGSFLVFSGAGTDESREPPFFGDPVSLPPLPRRRPPAGDIPRSRWRILVAAVTLPRSRFLSGAAAVSFGVFAVLPLPVLLVEAACLAAFVDSLVDLSPLPFFSAGAALASLSARCNSFFVCTFSLGSFSDRLCLEDLDAAVSLALLAFLSLMNCTSGVVSTAVFFSSLSKVSAGPGFVIGCVKLSRKVMKSGSWSIVPWRASFRTRLPGILA